MKSSCQCLPNFGKLIFKGARKEAAQEVSTALVISTSE
ncbi:hypothetical protein T4D_11259 [Trichinella pseudospiralis]|uniref:Uncharacterized protein n=1 Tax=Trichinella pseudospiralis TaxID=6337 RepID=A0A0V1EIV0_TRIPS|nr:hypothetical protein T4D_11259 [Trichinella pseudospiralis]